MSSQKFSAHERINTVLGIAVVVVCMYALALPYIPNLAYWWQNRYGNKNSMIAEQLDRETSTINTNQPTDDRLLIPTALIDEPIIQGRSLSVISKGGVWLRPNGASPASGGNTVIAGHRFTYQNPHGAFYHLDKVTVGDVIGLRWQGDTTKYVVQEVKIVKPSETQVEEPTADERLTIYTCTPLLTAEQRLVVIARPEKTNE
jgi:LPXTG-site transpeptidase (sortase) family protein